MKTFKFCPQTQEWKSYTNLQEEGSINASSATLSIDKLKSEFGLKIGTFNVLFDLVPFFLQPILRAHERHVHTIELLKRENFDIIVLNEVTGRFLNLIENDEFFKSEYYFSDILEKNDTKSENTMNLSIGRRMGNLVLSKFAPDFMAMELINKSRAFIYGAFTPVDGNGRRLKEERIAVVATHTSAYTHNDQVRKAELTRLVNSDLLKNVKNVAILGDLNLHEEHEDRTIEAIGCRDLWTETRSNGLFRGYTFDALNNSLIQMLFLNFEKRRMRLDRIIVNNSSLLGCNSKVELFGHEPISTYRKQGLNRTSLNTPFWFTLLRKVGIINITTDDYLFCSDHFGLKTSLVLCQSAEELKNLTSEIRNQDESSMNEYKEDSLERANKFKPTINYVRLVISVVALLFTLGYGISKLF